MSDRDDQMPQVIEAATTRAVGAWQPSILSELTDEEFEQRLRLASLERHRIQQVQRAVMKEGEDYGVIPGSRKPTLLKPGAETLNKMAGLSPSFETTSQFGDGKSAPHIHYIVTCNLTAPDGRHWSGVGSCNSWEKKYRYRFESPSCPDCGEQLRKSKIEQEWYCWRKKGGCGATYPADQFKAEQAENADPFDLDNTILKMAKKRAFVDATNTAHAASGIFTQDMDEQIQPAAPEPKKDPAFEAGAASPSNLAPENGNIGKAEARRLFAVSYKKGEELGLSRTQVEARIRMMLAERGHGSTYDLQAGDEYDGFLNAIRDWPPEPKASMPASDDPF